MLRRSGSWRATLAERGVWGFRTRAPLAPRHRRVAIRDPSRLIVQAGSSITARD
jgi:hypothetical protein